MSGQGIYTSENGKVRRGVWLNGKRQYWLDDQTEKQKFEKLPEVFENSKVYE